MSVVFSECASIRLAVLYATPGSPVKSPLRSLPSRLILCLKGE
jgi:hypothetical protein